MSFLLVRGVETVNMVRPAGTGHMAGEDIIEAMQTVTMMLRRVGTAGKGESESFHLAITAKYSNCLG
jgi:hypothetical protein